MILATVSAVVRRDLLLGWRRRSDIVTAVIFFVIVASLFPLGIGPEPNLLRSIAPGIIWVAALLSTMLSLDRLFSADHADGTLEQMLLSSAPLAAIVVGKVLAHWVMSGLPLVLVAPVLAVQFDLSQSLFGVLAVSLLLGTPVLSLIGAVGAALTIGVRGGGVLIALLVLPLYIPVLILGTSALEMAGQGQSVQAHLMLLAAMLIVAGTFAPWAIAASLRISSE